MSDDEFWRLTPPEFYALLKRWNEEQKRNDYRFGILAALLSSTKDNPTTPATFFPSLESEVSEEEQAENMMALMGYEKEK